jgi:hypothetical protein
MELEWDHPTLPLPQNLPQDLPQNLSQDLPQNLPQNLLLGMPQNLLLGMQQNLLLLLPSRGKSHLVPLPLLPPQNPMLPPLPLLTLILNRRKRLRSRHRS